MIVIMRTGAPRPDVERVQRVLRDHGARLTVFDGEERVVIAVHGAIADSALLESLGGLPGVDRVTPMSGAHRLFSRELRAANTVVEVGGARIGGPGLVVIAGPCIVESRAQLLEVAQAVTAGGASILRGDAYRASNSPYVVQGLGPEGLALLDEARHATGLPIATEVADVGQVESAAQGADLLEIGPDNMKSLSLLRAVGAARRPVILKRGLSATIEEWLTAAEHLMHAGNPNVILCERGIRTFEADRPSVLDLSAIPVVKRLSHLPVIVDPSHGTGHGYLVQPLALAAAAIGADGLLIEVHPASEDILPERPQSLSIAEFDALMTALDHVLAASGRTLARPGGDAAG